MSSSLNSQDESEKELTGRELSADEMVSAISLCLLAIGLSAASSQLLSDDAEFSDQQISERRTFKHGKPVKFLPLVKKHKKFGGFVPHVFAKPAYAEIPIVHESPKPFFKVHRFHGIHGVELKPESDVSFSTPEPYIESHSVEPPSGDFVSGFGSDHSFPSSSSVFAYPIHEKPILPPIFSSPSPAPFYAPIPPAPPKPIYSFVPAPQPVFTSLPISIPRPAPSPIHSFPSPAPVFTSFPAAAFPPQPIFSAVPVKYHAPALPQLPAPSPAPVFAPAPIKIEPPVLPSLPAPSPTPVVVKIPAPALPPLPAPSPAPVFSGLPSVTPTPGPVFHSFPTALPPAQISIPSPSPSLPTFPALSSVSVSVTPEPEFPYPPSGTPIPSYIKDISLGEIDLKGTPLPTIETPKYEEVSQGIVDDSSKVLPHGVIKNEHGFFQKFKGWKADKANAALSHFSHFKPKPFIPQPPNKIPVELPAPQVPVIPTLQFPAPGYPLPLAPAPVFFPPTKFLPPVKYENFPPNNIETPPLFNSYGAPIPHDSYGPPHIPHDRLSSAASEEESAVVPAPADKKEQNAEIKPQIRPEFQTQHFQPQAIPRDHPIYVPEDNKTIKDEDKTVQDVQPETEEYKAPKEPTSEDVATHNYPNHKEQ